MTRAGLILLTLSVGCSASRLDIGDEPARGDADERLDDGGSGDARDREPPPVELTDASACVDDAAADIATVDPTGSAVRYFHGGDVLPAGKYRIEYVDGCMRWGPELLGYQWTVHAGSPYGQPGGSCELVGSTRDESIAILPGTSGVPGFASYDACVAANAQVLALELDFMGGKLGVWVNDVNPSDDVGGEGQGACGASPTWRLVQL